MADENGAAQSASVWPMPKFHFKVMWNDVQMSFQEVSGLDAQSEEIKYRSGDSPIFSPVKMPGLVKYSNVTMKKGIFKGDNKFWDWFKKIKMNTIERTTVTISLLDEGGDGLDAQERLADQGDGDRSQVRRQRSCNRND